MSEEKDQKRIPNWQDPNWMELVNDEARRSFGGSKSHHSPPVVRNPSQVIFSPVEEAKIIGEARIDKKTLTK